MKKTISIILALFIIVSGILVSSANSFASDTKTVSGTFNYTYAAEVLTIVNKERRANGLNELTLTRSLTDSAMIRAAETTVSFSHTRPNGEQCFTAFEWTSAAGENIAYGQRTPEQVMQGWMNSSGHRANILSSKFTTMGIGCFEYGGRLYWAQAFSGGRGTSYAPSGTKAAAVEISLKSGVQSKVLDNESISSAVKSSTKSNTTNKAMTSSESTTKATTKATTSKTTKAAATSAAQSNNSVKKSIYEWINYVLKRSFKL